MLYGANILYFYCRIMWLLGVSRLHSLQHLSKTCIKICKDQQSFTHLQFIKIILQQQLDFYPGGFLQGRVSQVQIMLTKNTDSSVPINTKRMKFSLLQSSVFANIPRGNPPSEQINKGSLSMF